MKPETHFARIVGRLRSLTTEERQTVSTRSGVPFSTVQKIAYGYRPTPSWQVVERIRSVIGL